MLTDIFLIRHGAPQNNTGVEYRVMPGPPLSEKGRAEARQAAAFLADKELQYLFVSPFERAVQTAEQIVAALDVPVMFTELIQECHPQESLVQVRHRVSEFLAALQDSPFRRVALVSHGAPIGEMLRELSDDQIDLSKHSYDISRNCAPTAGIWHASRGSRSWQLSLVFQPDAKP
ncbi:MAG: histidine phosphatase family protein [Chloroflexaceae bacterium]|nr:histidine phosphatase family protein [Chloroflexaceae bacterium]